MVTKDLQIFSLKLDQVMFNSLVLTWERNFEVTFGIFSVLVFQISVLESYLDICFKISYDKNVKIVKIVIIVIKTFQSKFYQYFVFTKKILRRFVSFCISLIYTYCLHMEKKLVTIKHFLLNFFGGSKCVTKWQFLLIF